MRLVGPASLVLLVFLSACSTGGVMSKRPQRYLALGDSYTIGEAVAPSDRFPVLLSALLQAQGFNLGAPEIIARTGWTTDELSTGIDAASPRGSYDLVTLLIGVNNQYRGRSVVEYREQFRALLQRAIGFAGGNASRVVVLSIPDWGVTPFAEGRDRAKIAREIDQFNAVNRDETQKAGVHYVDVTPVSRQAAWDRSLVAEDGLHPSGKMYAEWARLSYPAAAGVLRRD